MKTMDTNNNEINLIEKKLDSILRPINPEERYVSNLKQRLLSKSNITIDRPNYQVIFLSISSFFIFGVFLVWV